MTETRIEEILRSHPVKIIGHESAPSTPSSTSLRDAISLMQKRRHSAVVITENDQVVGIFSERDLLNRIMGLALKDDLPISDVMTRKPKTLTLDDRIADAIRMMTELGYRHIPLVDGDGRFLGLLSARDIMEFIANHFPKEVTNLPPELNRVPQRPEGG